MPDASTTIIPLEIICPPSVRMAMPQDEAVLFDTLMALNEDNGFGIPVSPKRVAAQIRIGTRRQGGIIGVIDGDAGNVIGTIGLFISQMWYSEQHHLAEMWLFIRPEARNGKIQADLFQFAEWARQQMQSGSDHPWIVTTSVSSPKRLPAKLRLWRRYAKQVGGIFFIGPSMPDRSV